LLPVKCILFTYKKVKNKNQDDSSTGSNSISNFKGLELTIPAIIIKL